MKLKKGVKQLVDEANREVESVEPSEAQKLLDDEGVVFVDIRDVRELQREGKIPGAVHAPRGMLEFWVDPESPYHKEVFSSGKRFVLYCASAWRSALATKALKDMGFGPVAHLTGGFTAWRNAGAPVEQPQDKK